VNAASADRNASFDLLNASINCPVFSKSAACSTELTARYIELPTASLITMLLISPRSCDKDCKRKKCIEID
jgi:hypothetical protein